MEIFRCVLTGRSHVYQYFDLKMCVEEHFIAVSVLEWLNATIVGNVQIKAINGLRLRG